MSGIANAESSFGTLVCPALAAFLSGESQRLAESVFQEARARLPYLYCQAGTASMCSASQAVARIVRVLPGERIVVMACDALGHPHCFDEEGHDIARLCRWPAQRRLYTVKHYYFFVGVLSTDKERFTCYAVWNMAGLSIGEPIASRICEHLGIEIAPSVELADAEATNSPFLMCASNQPPKIVIPRFL